MIVTINLLKVRVSSVIYTICRYEKTKCTDITPNLYFYYFFTDRMSEQY